MEQRTFEAIQRLPREQLEVFALRAAVHVRDSRREAELSRYLVAVLTAFLLGVLVACSGFLLGASLG